MTRENNNKKQYRWADDRIVSIRLDERDQTPDLLWLHQDQWVHIDQPDALAIYCDKCKSLHARIVFKRHVSVAYIEERNAEAHQFGTYGNAIALDTCGNCRGEDDEEAFRETREDAYARGKAQGEDIAYKQWESRVVIAERENKRLQTVVSEKIKDHWGKVMNKAVVITAYLLRKTEHLLDRLEELEERINDPHVLELSRKRYLKTVGDREHKIQATTEIALLRRDAQSHARLLKIRRPNTVARFRTKIDEGGD